jgi:hypothetical protein
MLPCFTGTGTDSGRRFFDWLRFVSTGGMEMSARLKACASILTVLAACALGCGKGGPVTIPIRGEAFYNGQPMKDGIVVYLPKQPGVARQASGRILPDGTFELTTFKKADGVVPGDYEIVVYAYAPHPGEPKTRADHEAIAKAGGLKRGFLIPAKYVNPRTSGLSDTVNSEHSGFKKLELSG